MTACQNCNNMPCGTGFTGNRRCYIDTSISSSLWCSPNPDNRQQMFFNCSCTDAGYYKNEYGSNAYTCTICPNNPPATGAAGSTSIINCYIPANSLLSDATGSYLFSSNCFYS
ncbi:MAG: hypothetical protein LBD50_02920 [Rickettsiales bacterium]|nr:hypothetical protein [Rickettsiales bacterium]